MDAPNFNADKPSRADHFRRDPYSSRDMSDAIDKGIKAAQESVGEVSEQASQALARGNTAVAKVVDPIPAIALAAIMGLIGGYMLGARGQD